jgi:hypothetical protein
MTERGYVVVDPDHRRACGRCGSVIAAGELSTHDRFHAEIDGLATARIHERLYGPPLVMLPADAYERLRMLAVQLDGELLAIRQLVAADPGKLLLKRELLTILARTDYWYDMWKDARGEYDAPLWRGPAGKDGIWTMQT